MSFVNVGAFVVDSRPLTKKALRDAIASDPSKVFFDSTTMYGPHGGKYFHATVEDIGTDKLSVAGPDPYSSRKWNATVQIVNGKIKVS